MKVGIVGVAGSSMTTAMRHSPMPDSFAGIPVEKRGIINMGDEEVAHTGGSHPKADAELGKIVTSACGEMLMYCTVLLANEGNLTTLCGLAREIGLIQAAILGFENTGRVRRTKIHKAARAVIRPDVFGKREAVNQAVIGIGVVLASLALSREELEYALGQLKAGVDAMQEFLLISERIRVESRQMYKRDVTMPLLVKHGVGNVH